MFMRVGAFFMCLTSLTYLSELCKVLAVLPLPSSTVQDSKLGDIHTGGKTDLKRSDTRRRSVSMTTILCGCHGIADIFSFRLEEKFISAMCNTESDFDAANLSTHRTRMQSTD